MTSNLNSINKHPSVSIYVVTYLDSEERGQVLRRTCEWLLKQRYPNFEVVVSDNMGEYSAVEALASIQDSRLKVCENEENAGFTGNMNRCLEHCSYNIIKPLCDDDLIHPDFLTATVPLVDDETLVLVDVEKFLFGTDPAGIERPLERSPAKEMRRAGYGSDIWTLPYSSCCIPSAVIFSRDLFQQIGGFDKNTITSDWNFLIESCLSKNVVHLQQTLSYVGVWEGSLTEQMAGNPFFFPRERLYTKCRILRCKPLTLPERGGIVFRLLRELTWQSLRPFKHPLKKTYYTGYSDYIRAFLKWIISDKMIFER